MENSMIPYTRAECDALAASVQEHAPLGVVVKAATFDLGNKMGVAMQIGEGEARVRDAVRVEPPFDAKVIADELYARLARIRGVAA